ncbi:MAG: LysM peptidoglycan-binding domain-containing protein [Candidatus Melainabacteria bacterium]|nr:LysM peptidoglycan-binding domain-containing protein [Candidatus Melainabacteria bacterium]
MQSKLIYKAICSALAVVMVTLTTPIYALAMPEIPHFVDKSVQTPLNKEPIMGSKTVKLVKPQLHFSAAPTDLEITTARVFHEPLVPMNWTAVDGENLALVESIKAFKAKNDPADLAAFESFLAKYPKSRWAPSVQINVGQIKFLSGYLSEALQLWRDAWQAAKGQSEKDKAAVANQAVSNLLILNARLGCMEELKKYFQEIEGRAFYGSEEEKVRSAREGYWNMEHRPDCSFRCGPLAINSILQKDKRSPGMNERLEKCQSTKSGTTFAQVKDWAKGVGLNYQLAKRSKGAPFITPSVVHWKLDHFGALLSEENGKYHLQDPTFDSNGQLWISADALEKETDGYFLVPSDKPLPQGWALASEDEAKSIHGKGNATSRTAKDCSSFAPKTGMCTCEECEKNNGMPTADAYSMLTTLHIADTPLSYSPPIGPTIDFSFDYNHLQPDQPSTFTFTNLGQNWNFGWLSYLTVDSGSNVASVRIMGGGTEVYTPSAGVYSPDFLSQALLVNMGSGVYERRLKDGSVQVYNQADSSSPPRIFMTQVKDPQGNTVSIQYDANFRITSVVDAIGQASTINYVSNTVGNAGFYKISSIADPFGRTCSFGYDSTVTNLLSITDAVSLKSSFQYDSTSSFISQMTTPYGTTSFYDYVPGIDVWPARGLRFTFADGTSSVLENWINETKSSYFWDRHVMQMYPNDPVNKIYTHCKVMKFTYNNATGQEASSMQWVQNPLETRTYLTYATNAGPNYSGFNNLPLTLTKDIGNPVVNAEVGGTVTAGDGIAFYIDYVYAGYTVQAGDTLEKIATELAKAVNNSTDYQSRGIYAAAIGKVVSLRSEQAGMTKYAPWYSPGATETLKFNSQARQTAIGTLNGTITSGDTVYLYVDTNTSRITFSYVVQPGDTAASICSAFATQMNANGTWQYYNGTATASGGNINLQCFSQEVVTYNTGTSGTESFGFASYRNGSTSLVENQYNSTGNMTQTIDPIGRKFSYSYDSNGVDLLEARETQGTDNYLLGHWEYNSKHQPLVYIDGSAQRTEYTYNSSGQVLTVKDPNNNTTTMTYTGTCQLTVGGTVTVGNVLTVTVFDAGLSGGQKSVNYTVPTGATLTSIASGIRNAINADTALAAVGVTATSAAAVVTLTSTSVNVTTYTKATSGGATVTLALGANRYGFLTKVDGPLSGNQDITTVAYDTVGRISSVTDSDGYTVSYTYDNLDRQLRTTYPDGTFDQTIYDRMDAVLMKDRNNRWTQVAYDSMDQKRYEIDPAGRKTQYTWCTCGSLGALTDPLGRTTSWSHDIQGRLTTKTYPDSSTYTYLYEQKTNNVKTRTDARGQKTNYFYNPDRSLFQASYPNAVTATAPVAYYWDYFFKRLNKVTKNDWGSYNYSYNNYVTSSGATPITGGGKLQQVTNDVIANSAITYQYDALGRTTNRSINGAANSVTWSYDAISRVTSEVNALGTFNYAYENDTPGSSKGSDRLAAISYPNGQTTKYTWYPNLQDQRLQQIANLGPSGNTISQFSYRYDPAGQIKQWQQLQGNTSLNYALDYDQAGQLVSASASGGPLSPNYLKQYYYAYDSASNRTGVQTSTVTRGRVSGTVTAGNVLTVTVTDQSLSSGSKAINYTVVGGDTLSTIATKMAAAIAADADMINIGVTASANAAVLSIKSASPNVTSYSASTSGGATASIALNATDNFVENAVIGGTKKTGDILTITFKDPALSGGSKNVNYTVLAADTLTTIATALRNAINADTALQAIGVTATSTGTTITIRSTSQNATTYGQSVSTGSTETISLSVNQNGPVRIGIGGSKTTGDTVSLVTYDAALSGGTRTTTYTVLAGDTLSTIASGLAAAINADTNLQGIGVSAAASGTVVTVQSNSTNPTTYRGTTSTTATETILIGLPTNGAQVLVIGGTKTTGDTLTVTVFDPQLSGGSKAVNYVVQAGDTLTSIATNMASAITADTDFQAIAVSATASGTVVFINSGSKLLTTYASSTSGGATETLSLASSTSANQYGYNNLNELTSIAAGGATRFEGTANKALKSATVNSNAANLPDSQKFAGNGTLSSGANTIPASVTDGTNTTKTSSYRVSTKGSASSSPTFDANGNMTSDGTNTYEWDAENRLVKINYPGMNNTTSLKYDSFSRNIQLLEIASGATVDTRQFVWNTRIYEERDGSGSVINKFFDYGSINSSGSRYLSKNQIGSTTELTDSSGGLIAAYVYDSFGCISRGNGTINANFLFGGYFWHERSGLSLTKHRGYSNLLARWLSRDPIGESIDSNLYCYVNNSPVSFIDPFGLAPLSSSVRTSFSGAYEGTKSVIQNGPVVTSTVASLTDQAFKAQEKAKLPNYPNGPEDAYRHCVWSCFLTKSLGERVAQKVTINHELAGIYMGDSLKSVEMDTLNNWMGRQAGMNCRRPCEDQCMNLLLGGQLFGINGIPLLYVPAPVRRK